MNDIIEYLNSKNWTFKQQGKELILNCPYCGKENKFSIQPEKKVFKCWVCSEKGSFTRLKKDQGDYVPIFHASRLNPEPKKTFPLEQIEKWHKDLMEHPALILWLDEKRGLTKETLAKYQIGLELIQDQQAIIFPYFDAGKVTLLKKRFIHEKKFIREKDCPSPLFGMQNVKGNDSVFVVEGEFDCLAGYQLGFENVVSVPCGGNGGGSGPDDVLWIKQLDRFKEVTLALDNDEAGEKASLELARKLGFHRVKRLLLPEKDLNDCLTAGLTKEEILSNSITKDFKDEDLIHARDLLESVVDLWQDSEKSKGIQTSFGLLNKTLGGIRPDEVTTITANTGSGKTTYALNIIEDMTAQGIPCLVASTEMNPQKVMSKLFSIHSDKNFYDKTSMNEEVVKSEVRYWNSRPLYFVDVHGALSMTRLKDILKYAALILGVKFVLLDHLHFFLGAKRPEDERFEIEKFMKELVGITLELHIHVFLICHPTKSDDDKRPTMNDLKGSAAIKQDSHNVMTLWRDKQAEAQGLNLVEVCLPKVRDDSGPGGKFVMEFDYRTQKYRDYDAILEPLKRQNGKKNIQYLDPGLSRSDIG